MRSVRFAHGLRPSCMQLWAEPNREHRKGLIRSLPIPRKHLFRPKCPMMSVLGRPRNASCRIGSDYHGFFFPRSYSGHCPWAALHLLCSSSLLLQYVHTDVSVPGQSTVETLTHRLRGIASEGLGQVTKVLSVIPIPLCICLTAGWHSTYIQWLSRKYLHQRKKSAHEPRLDNLAPPYRDLRMTSG
jgi:hypothetical protein